MRLLSAHIITLRLIRRRLRCFRHTQGLHQVDLHSGECAYCKRPWAVLYPADVVTPRTTHALKNASRSALT